MGQVILPSGKSVHAEDVDGSIHLENLIKELEIVEFTDAYRIAVISAIGRLGKYSDIALPKLNKIREGQNRLLKEAAEQAIKKIDVEYKELPVTETVVKVPPPPPPTTYPYHGRGRYREKINVKITPLNLELMEGCISISHCDFCQKAFESTKKSKEIFPNRRLCKFCCRSKHYCPEVVKNIVGINYNALIGYIYYTHVAKNSVFFFDLKEMVKEHVDVGLANPLFNYDNDNFQWYIDMGMVKSGQITLSTIASTIISQLSVLGIGELFQKGSPYKIYQKIMSAIKNGEKLIVPLPTDGECNIGIGVPIDVLEEFSPALLVDSALTRRRY